MGAEMLTLYEDTRPILSGRVNTIVDAYVLACAHRASITRPYLKDSRVDSIYIREDHHSDNHAWPDVLLWEKYAKDDDFIFYSDPAGDGIREKVLDLSCEGTSYHLVAYLSDNCLTLPSPCTDQNFLELIYEVR